MAQNLSITGEDGRPTTTPIFCYAIRNLQADEAFYITSYEQGIEIEGLPSEWGADDPQMFTPAQVGHGTTEKRDGIDKVSFDVQALIQAVPGLSRYTLFGAIPKIEISIIKVLPGPVLEGIPAIYGRDTILKQMGIIETFGTQGYVMSARCTPEALITGHQVPRWRFTRTCNRILGAPDCGVDLELYKLEGNILSMNYQARTLVLSGQRPPTDDENYFRMGVMLHGPTQTRHSIFQSSYSGPDDTRIWLTQWFPDMEIGDPITIYAGCIHTLDACKNKFANDANFGGFPLIPNKNPSLHGV